MRSHEPVLKDAGEDFLTELPFAGAQHFGFDNAPARRDIMTEVD